MKYKPTTVYLDAADYARLKREAAARGISLAQLFREIASAHVGESAPPYGAKGWDALIGVATSDGEPTDVASKKDEYLDEAMDDVYEKKMGRAPKDPLP